ncbi:MAG: ABC transporter permease [Gemmatales bacterium]|nr:ABC transporter permease [Gemmatales bacterium]MDW8176570.1 ABC transporter permease [Gemmatales bacterium]
MPKIIPVECDSMGKVTHQELYSNDDVGRMFRHSGQCAAPVIIEAQTTMSLRRYLREMLRYRELLLFLVWRDVLIKYRRTVLGLGWILIQPALQTCILWWFIGGRLSNEGRSETFLLQVLLGTTLWLYGANTILLAIHQLSSSGHLISKVYFPRALLAIAPALAHLLDLGVMSLLLGGVLAVFHTWHLKLGLLALCYLGTVLFVLGPALVAGGLAARFRDIKHVAPYLMQVWFLSTPAIYLPYSSRSAALDLIGIINPLDCWVSAGQALVIDAPMRVETWLIAITGSLLWCLGGLWLFIRLERNLADHV